MPKTLELNPGDSAIVVTADGQLHYYKENDLSGFVSTPHVALAVCYNRLTEDADFVNECVEIYESAGSQPVTPH